MEVRALLVCTDNITSAVARRALLTVGVTVQPATPADALEQVRRSKFDAVIVDVSSVTGRDLLGAIRHEPSSRKVILFAITESKATMRDAFQLGATFVLDKPLTLDRTLRCFRAAYGLIVGERRRYQRVKASTAISLQAGSREATAYTIDISTGGLLIETPIELGADAQVKVQFALPNSDQKIAAVCGVIWCAGGRAGLHFMKFSRQGKETLGRWIGDQIDRAEGVNTEFAAAAGAV